MAKEPLSPEMLRKASILGWCIEWVRGSRSSESTLSVVGLDHCWQRLTW
jgi:hypothetical protein